jgi:uncharacterized membrane protein
MLKKGFWLSLVIFVTLFPLVLAQEPNVFLTLTDAITKEPISDVFVRINSEQVNNYFLEADDTLKLHLESGNYNMEFLVNDPNTDGYDYFGETYLSVKNNTLKVIYLYPVGSLDGFVKDKLENVIKNAELKFQCNNVFTVDFPKGTDKFGSFSLEYVPIGECKVFGTYQDITGSQDVTISKGAKTNVDISLDQVVVSNQNYNLWGGVIIVFFILLIIGIALSLNKKVSKKEDVGEVIKKEVKNIEKSVLGSRGKDIYRTLRDNEKKVVDFLLQQGSPVHLSKIHYKTGMSKGSLFRNLESLEKKSIVETHKEGKVRKAKLSSWFQE